MQTNKFIKRCLLGIVLLGTQSVANAALLGTCTFAGGCGPDFSILNAAAVYDWDDASSGTLTITGAVGNVSTLPGQLEPWPDASEMTGILAGTNPDVSIPVNPATVQGNDDFLLSLTVDGAGALQTGSLSMNGKVEKFFSSFNNSNTNFQAPGGYTAISANGTVLDGALIAAGSTITALGFSGNVFDFDFTLHPSSVLAQAFSSSGEGIATLTNISSSSGSIEWTQDWSATANLDVIVPLPAAFWLFLSGMAALFSVSNSRLKNKG